MVEAQYFRQNSHNFVEAGEGPALWAEHLLRDLFLLSLTAATERVSMCFLNRYDEESAVTGDEDMNR